jgi:hypothetical protein
VELKIPSKVLKQGQVSRRKGVSLLLPWGILNVAEVFIWKSFKQEDRFKRLRRNFRRLKK